MAKSHVIVTFLGATQTVTGSKYLVRYGDGRVLVDAGMFLGEKHWREQNWAPFPVHAASLSGVVLTHAHLDHVGYLPVLVKNGFTGPVWCTLGTAELAEIVLRDAGRLQENDAEDAARRGYSRHYPPLPLFTEEDAERVLPLLRVVDFNDDLELGDGLMARLVPAGHILGSASARLWTEDPDGDSVLFSGDLGRHEHPVLARREVPEGADAVVIESTYGDREHPGEDDPTHERLADAITRTIERDGSVLIPAFAVDRTEILLKTLDEMQRDRRIPLVTIFMDSPMGAAALDVYRDPRLAGDLNSDLDPRSVRPANLCEVRSVEQSIALNTPARPCIIISSSGMATGGRVVHHLQHMLPDPRNCVVFPGYQAVGTRGRRLVDGASEIKMFGRYVPVRAEIVHDESFSVHADASDLLDWLADLKPIPRIVYCTHGEPDAASGLASRIRDRFGCMAVVPSFGESVRL